ncbi:CMP-N-acetylneuraminate-beta-galactosamide-alpha-2,3-sialyltransferase 1 [Characodon lateralis]|uniref:CMP-N-acetylneuraminate-beta-galactosamide-alpha-2,3-sialyltransferase 1 n=1 Tax=Characodon lateralis TaxID=208331 RepID=A0ABU7DV87_9TELE|nr:CMP-N-acetylneuraminate-beta-galactosamide-alpha-2,3-sialyltransferase 1 [Characodon lateralis]
MSIRMTHVANYQDMAIHLNSQLRQGQHLSQKQPRSLGNSNSCRAPLLGMNQAPTNGFEEDVGTRTTHHVMYPESAIDLDNSTSLVLIPFKTLDLQWIISALTTGTIKHTYLPVMPRIKANKDKVLIYNPTFFKYVHESWLEGHGRYPSTGFLSLLLALHICDEVSVFGFGADQYGNWHHYWEENHLAGAFRHTGVHDGDYEYNVTLLLAEKHKIHMFTGR